MSAITTQQAVDHLMRELQADPSFAMAWQSNIAMPILDGCRRRGVRMDHATANALADDLMLHLFNVKPVQGNPWKVRAVPGAVAEI